MRRKIEINKYLDTSIKEVYTSFIISKTASGISETTLNGYKYQFRTISKYIDILGKRSDLKKVYTYSACYYLYKHNIIIIYKYKPFPRELLSAFSP